MLVPQSDFSQWRSNCGEFNVSSISVLAKIFPPPTPQKYNVNPSTGGINNNTTNKDQQIENINTNNNNNISLHTSRPPTPALFGRPTTPKLTKSSSRSKDINNLLDEFDDDYCYLDEDDDDDDEDDDIFEDLNNNNNNNNGSSPSSNNKLRHRVLVRQGEHCFVSVLPVRGEIGKKSSIVAWNRDASVITRCGHEEAYELHSSNNNLNANINNNNSNNIIPPQQIPTSPAEPERIRWLSSVETIGRYSSVFATCTKSTVIVWLVRNLAFPPSSVFNNGNPNSSTPHYHQGKEHSFPKVLREGITPILICKAPNKTKKLWSPCLYLEDVSSGNPNSIYSHSHHHHQNHFNSNNNSNTMNSHPSFHHHHHHHHHHGHHQNVSTNYSQQQQQQMNSNMSNSYYGPYNNNQHQQFGSNANQNIPKFISTSIDVLFFADTHEDRRLVCRCGVTLSISSIDDSWVELGERPLEILQGDQLVMRGRQDLEKEKEKNNNPDLLQQQQQATTTASAASLNNNHNTNNHASTTNTTTGNSPAQETITIVTTSSSSSSPTLTTTGTSIKNNNNNNSDFSKTFDNSKPDNENNNNITNENTTKPTPFSSFQQQPPPTKTPAFIIETGFGNGGNLLPEKDSVFGQAPTKSHHPPALMAALAPLFAFTVADDAIVTSAPGSCSTTPSWVPCEDCPGEPLVSIAWIHSSGNCGSRDRIFDGNFRSAKRDSYRLVCANSRRIVITKVGLGGQPEKIQKIVCNGVNPATGTGLLFRSVFCTFDSRIWVEYVYHNVKYVKPAAASSTGTTSQQNNNARSSTNNLMIMLDSGNQNSTTVTGASVAPNVNQTISSSPPSPSSTAAVVPSKPKISQHLELACIEFPSDETSHNHHQQHNNNNSQNQAINQQYSFLTSKISNNAIKLGLQISSKPLRLNNIHLSCCLYQNRFLGKFSSLISPQIFLYDPMRRRLCLTTTFSCLEKMDTMSVATVIPRHMRVGNAAIAPVTNNNNNNTKATSPNRITASSIASTSSSSTSTSWKFGVKPGSTLNCNNSVVANSNTTAINTTAAVVTAAATTSTGKIWKFGVAPSSFGSGTASSATSSKISTNTSTPQTNNNNNNLKPPSTCTPPSVSTTEQTSAATPKIWKFGKAAPPAISLSNSNNNNNKSTNSSPPTASSNTSKTASTGTKEIFSLGVGNSPPAPPSCSSTNPTAQKPNIPDFLSLQTNNNENNNNNNKNFAKTSSTSATVTPSKASTKNIIAGATAEDLFPAHTTPSSLGLLHTLTGHSLHHQQQQNTSNSNNNAELLFSFPTDNNITTINNNNSNLNGSSSNANFENNAASSVLGRRTSTSNNVNNNILICQSPNVEDEDENKTNANTFGKLLSPVAISGSARFEEGAREVLIFLKNSGALKEEFASLILDNLEEEEESDEEKNKNSKNENDDDDDNNNTEAKIIDEESEENKKKRIELVKNIAAILERIETKKNRAIF